MKRLHDHDLRAAQEWLEHAASDLRYPGDAGKDVGKREVRNAIALAGKVLAWATIAVDRDAKARTGK